MKKKSMIWAVIILSTVVIGIFAINADKASSFENVRNFQGEIKLYKSGSCGCCGVYSSYFRSKGNSETEIISMESIDSIKQEYEIPLELESCHTTIIGDYFIEGHIPLEAVERLMME